MNYNSVQNIIYSPLVFCHIRSHSKHMMTFLVGVVFCGQQTRIRNESHNESLSSLKYAHIQFEMRCKIIHHIWMKQRFFPLLTTQRCENRISTFLQQKKKHTPSCKNTNAVKTLQTVDKSKYAIHSWFSEQKQHRQQRKKKPEIPSLNTFDGTWEPSERTKKENRYNHQSGQI